MFLPIKSVVCANPVPDRKGFYLHRSTMRRSKKSSTGNRISTCFFFCPGFSLTMDAINICSSKAPRRRPPARIIGITFAGIILTCWSPGVICCYCVVIDIKLPTSGQTNIHTKMGFWGSILDTHCSTTSNRYCNGIWFHPALLGILTTHTDIVTDHMATEKREHKSLFSWIVP